MQFFSVLTLLASGAVMAAPPLLPNTNSLIGQPSNNTNDLIPIDYSCVLVLSSGEVHCAEDLGPDSGVVFPPDNRWKMYAEYRDCKLKGKSVCELPHYTVTLDEIFRNFWGTPDELADELDRRIPGFGLRGRIDELSGSQALKNLHVVNGESLSPEAGSGMAVANVNCCTKMCGFAALWGPIAFGLCLLTCNCPS